MNNTEQELTFIRLQNTIGRDMALYCMCAVLNLPYNSESDAESWEEYRSESEKGEFADGETDVNAAFLAGMPTAERWATLWGDGYSESDYRQLDDLYRTMTAQLDSTGGIDRQQDDTARTCALMALQRNKLIRKADKDSVAMAKQYDAMIRDNLKDSNMRKADILPTATQKLPTIVDVLRKNLNLNVDNFTQDDVWAAFYAWCKKKKYPFTMDAVEHIIMLIMNLIQKNDDMPELYQAPDDMNFGPYEAEFEKEPNEAEMEAYDYLGLVRGEWSHDEDGSDS
jgi:hypothetical protein